MPTVDISQFEDSFTIYFGSDYSRINAYTLATTLVGIADAAKAANNNLNPGYEIEVVVEALAPGSFKATLRTIYSEAENLFSKESLRTVVLAVIANFVYQHTLAPDTDVQISVENTQVRIIQGDTEILVPREVHEATQQVESSTQFRRGIGNAVRAVEADSTIDKIGFSPDEEQTPEVPIPRERLASLSEELAGPSAEERDMLEITDLQIVRAILERSRRMWQFVWNGIRISAPLTDEQFYNEFFAHRITIAPGDVLRVRLRVRQRRDKDLGIYLNESYEVVEVLEHRPRSAQSAIPYEKSDDT
ncbi:MAG: hypothetical protein AAF541_04950 [Pseudomonadota bacterium]